MIPLMPRKIDISHKTIIFVTIFFLSLWILYQILDLILLLFVALIFMSAISPVVSFLSRFKFPKALSILLVYMIIIGILGTMLTISFTPLIEQTSRLIQVLPDAVSKILQVGNVDQSFLQKELGNLTGNVFSVTKSIFDNVLTIVLLLVLTFYLLLEKEGLEKRVAQLFIGQEDRVKKLLVKVEEKLGSWLRGQLALSIIIGTLSFIGLTILQVPYALPLAIWAGLLEVVPVIGPIVSAIPAMILGFTISPVLGAGVIAMYFVIQQLENHLIVPQVMRKAVGLNPLIVILAISVGGRLLGIGGALLAVPIVVVGQIIVTEILKENT
jgi:predicted PurR-regulated permease PerM